VVYDTHSLYAVCVLNTFVHVALDADVHLVVGSVSMVIQRQGFAVAEKQEHLASYLVGYFDVDCNVFHSSHNALLDDPQLAVSVG
jgi:hypothetical protein